MILPSVTPTLARLNEAASSRRADPFVEIHWDGPDADINPTDSRWIHSGFDPLIATAWFAGMKSESQSRFCLARLCAYLLMTVESEALLQVGLLCYMQRLSPGSDEARFVYNEVIEEAQHSQMFLEFVRRALASDDSLPRPPTTTSDDGTADSFFGRHLPQTWAFQTAPELLFWSCLCGEEPVDVLQRRYLKEPARNRSALLEEIYRLHIAEEARHLTYARERFTALSGSLSGRSRRLLCYRAPMIATTYVEALIDTPEWVRVAFNIPDGAFDEPSYRVARERMVHLVSSPLVSAATRNGVLVSRTTPLWRRLASASDLQSIGS